MRGVSGVLLIAALAAAPAGTARAQSELDASDAGARTVVHPAPAPRRPDPAPVVEAAAPQPPENLRNLSEWIQYKTRAQRYALPEEARIFYRRGLTLWESNRRDEAVQLMRGAAELDPMFADPRLTLVSWFLIRDPGQALVEAAALVQFARDCFSFQLELLANGLFSTLQALYLGLLAAAFLILVLHLPELRHGCHERLVRVLPPRAAAWWTWGFIALPFAIGMGVAWGTVVLLGLLWPNLKVRERSLFVLLLAALAVAPWMTVQMTRLASPLRQDSAPFYGMLSLQSDAYSPESHRRLEELSRAHPNEPLLEFGLAWSARQGNDYAAAEQDYRRAIELRPGDDRAFNNLGNILAIQGRLDDAIAAYHRATEVNPSNAVAYFNLSQVHTRRFDYHAANEALAHASALNFDLLRTHQSQPGEDGQLPVVDQWIAPKYLWSALLETAPAAGSGSDLPAAWRGHIETSGWLYSSVTVVCALIAIVLGIVFQRSVPLRRCSNCERVVCRRCATRRRELALCGGCAAVEARAAAPDFARVLLLEHRRKSQRTSRLVRTALATLIPGYGLFALRRVFSPLMLMITAAGIAVTLAGDAAPFAYLPTSGSFGPESAKLAAALSAVIVYAFSILGYFAELRGFDDRPAFLQRSSRPRASAPRRVTQAAA
jgi:tetratricopeptide (TPR) repeat protein